MYLKSSSRATLKYRKLPITLTDYSINVLNYKFLEAIKEKSNDSMDSFMRKKTKSSIIF
jgi:arsenate reductase-like glutaredoxin family protein